MQAISSPASDGHNLNHVDIQLSADFASAVKIEASDDADVTLSAEIEEEEEEEEEDVEDEFTFFCANPDGSPISADGVFQDGQIRPVYPVFNRDLLFSDGDDASPSLRPPLKKLFFEDHDGGDDSASESDEVDAAVPAEGSYCERSKNASPELKNNKSNSTGSSKLWKIRDLVRRSNSDGKDAFVFLNPVSAAARLKQSKDAGKAKPAAVEEKVKDKGQKGKLKKGKETVSSAHEKHYVMNRAKKEGEKRRSYLPYRPGVVGFFANVNVLSKNVHPF